MTKTIAIIGGGPSGLMTAEVLSAQGFEVSLYERKPSLGRKLLMAGRGGLNITHSEDLDKFTQKYGSQSDPLSPIIHAFPPQALREWCAELGEKTFIGSSGRVFPESFKASPLLRAWIKRLENQGVRFMLSHDWQGWDNDSLIFQTPDKQIRVKPDATLLALGGASWPRLGADGSWVKALEEQGIEVAPLRPSNCGFHVKWSSVFLDRFSGHPLKSVGLSFQGREIRGEFVITEKGVEGGAIYALSALLRDQIYQSGSAKLILDLKPDLSIEEIVSRLQKPRAKLSLSNYLRKTLKLPNVVIGLLMETLDRTKLSEYTAAQLAQSIKLYELPLNSPFSIDKAISTAGGVTFNSINDDFMLKNKSGVFVTGEMLDWEAPTGGYLLQACIASGVHVAKGITNYLSID
jgi:uncharacterized flavoprotein (TIGR03862 family)